MKTRELVQVALLLAIGYVLHAITPPLVGGMKPDLLLSMLFVILLLFRDLKLGIVAGAVAGILSALATTFPGGQIPNVIDKLITSLIVIGLIYLLQKVNDKVLAGVVGLIGTVVSGTVFLGSALILVGLPAPFKILFTSVVLPAALINTVAIVILYPIVAASRNAIIRRTASTGAAR
ncbi:MAG: tryptophan transporter [Symbiobacteriia bacterium]